MKTKDVKSVAMKASAKMLKEMIIKFGIKFTCDFEDVKRGKPLYVVLVDLDGEISPSPMFPRLEVAETFVEGCRKYLPGFKEKELRIYKLTAA